MSDAAVWHELECWGYDADLDLWRELADAHGGPIVDLGAGTGRVARALAADGHEVLAVDLDGELLGELARAADGLPIDTLVADARAFTLAHRSPLILLPMQTAQLLGGSDGRAAMLACARAALAPGGLLAAAIAEEVEPYAADALVEPVVTERDGVRYESDAFAIVEQDDAFVLHHARTRQAPDGDCVRTVARTRLDRLDAATLEAEGRRAGLTVLERRVIGATDDHVGSTVVMLGG